MNSALQTAFYQRFLLEMQADRLSPEQMARHVWQPHLLDQLPLSGSEAETSLTTLAASPAQIRQQLAALSGSAQPDPQALCQRQDLALLLIPGFSHETLRHYSWHDIIHDKRSRHQIVELNPGDDQAQSSSAVRETFRSQGPGLRLAYLRYPRSNGDSRHIVPAMARMLQHSPTLQQWRQEGRKLVVVGYSNGAALGLELLAQWQNGTLEDQGQLEQTAAFISLCGDIGGSYLADDVTSDDPQFLDIAALVKRCQRFPLLGKLVGLDTPQRLQDMLDGVRALGHPVRQQKLARDLPRLPAHLHYLSLGAVLPLADYKRKLWHWNLDDYSMWKQAQITQPITPYHDGQVALADAIIPRPDHHPASQHHYLGAVRTHHWGVSYRTFNQGRNRFPRQALYRALLGTLEGVVSE